MGVKKRKTGADGLRPEDLSLEEHMAICLGWREEQPASQRMATLEDYERIWWQVRDAFMPSEGEPNGGAFSSRPCSRPAAWWAFEGPQGEDAQRRVVGRHHTGLDIHETDGELLARLGLLEDWELEHLETDFHTKQREKYLQTIWGE